MEPVRSRLPRPSTRTRVRKEIVLRSAAAADAAACALIDGAYTTTHIWQLDTRQDADELRVCFRQVRLPRDLTLVAAHKPPTLPAGTSRRSLFWMVAEEVEVDGRSAGISRGDASGDIPSESRTSAQEHPWDHALRQTGRSSTIQLSLPRQAEAQGPARVAHDAPDDSAPPRKGEVVGYIAVAASSRDPNAYLRSLVVSRSHRRHGTASRLLAEAKRWAMRQGATHLMADVAARNFPAIRLLQKGGFTFCGYNDRCYPDQEVAIFFSAPLR
ncbi:MAG TPA: GNAT family N-acetyltransferase [Chloroflexota bacterium]|nr:GNAT family N-acetyltransferase [Chloroflexota bacterium]